VDAVLPLGDTQYESARLSDYRGSYDPTWGAFKGLSYPVIGNHEYRDPDAQGFLSYFGSRVPNQRVWYARNLGAWRVYVLNSNCDRVNCSAQVKWLSRRRQWLLHTISDTGECVSPSLRLQICVGWSALRPARQKFLGFRPTPPSRPAQSRVNPSTDTVVSRRTRWTHP